MTRMTMEFTGAPSTEALCNTCEHRAASIKRVLKHKTAMTQCGDMSRLLVDATPWMQCRVHKGYGFKEPEMITRCTAYQQVEQMDTCEELTFEKGDVLRLKERHKHYEEGWTVTALEKSNPAHTTLFVGIYYYAGSNNPNAPVVNANGFAEDRVLVPVSILEATVPGTMSLYESFKKYDQMRQFV